MWSLVMFCSLGIRKDKFWEQQETFHSPVTLVAAFTRHSKWLGCLVNQRWRGNCTSFCSFMRKVSTKKVGELLKWKDSTDRWMDGCKLAIKKNGLLIRGVRSWCSLQWKWCGPEPYWFWVRTSFKINDVRAVTCSIIYLTQKAFSRYFLVRLDLLRSYKFLYLFIIISPSSCCLG